MDVETVRVPRKSIQFQKPLVVQWQWSGYSLGGIIFTNTFGSPVNKFHNPASPRAPIKIWTTCLSNRAFNGTMRHFTVPGARRPIQGPSPCWKRLLAKILKSVYCLQALWYFAMSKIHRLDWTESLTEHEATWNLLQGLDRERRAHELHNLLVWIYKARDNFRAS